MAEAKRESIPSIGFITVRKHREHGYFGGLLILNTLGRPLEFHCTLPIKPSRAQEVLFGHTLDDFLCGEQIGRALLCKAKIAPCLVLTDCSAVLSVRLVSEQLIAFVSGARESTVATQFLLPTTNIKSLNPFTLRGYPFATLLQSDDDVKAITRVWDELKLELDLLEPFERIGEALLEAHPAARAA